MQEHYDTRETSNILLKVQHLFRPNASPIDETVTVM